MLWVKCLFIWYLSVFKPLEFKKDYMKPELFLFEAGDDGSLMMLCVSSGFWEIQTPTAIGHVTLMAIAGTTVLVPYFLIKTVFKTVFKYNFFAEYILTRNVVSYWLSP